MAQHFFPVHFCWTEPVLRAIVTLRRVLHPFSILLFCDGADAHRINIPRLWIVSGFVLDQESHSFRFNCGTLNLIGSNFLNTATGYRHGWLLCVFVLAHAGRVVAFLAALAMCRLSTSHFVLIVCVNKRKAILMRGHYFSRFLFWDSPFHGLRWSLHLVNCV